MAVSPLIRIVAAAFALSTLSFAAGVAGDLSSPPPASGTRVVLVIPPQAPRAIPMPSLPRTAAAEARARIVRPARAEQLVGTAEVPPSAAMEMAAFLPQDHEMCHSEPNLQPVPAPKGEPRKLS